MRADVSAIKAVMPHLATRADVSALRGEVAAVEGSLKAEINALETKVIKWIIGSVITSASLAFAIARFVS